jgi:hypothetical protein
VFRIHRGIQVVVDVDSIEAIEEFGRSSQVGTYDVDLISLDEIDGRTSRAWGTVTRHADGKVVVEPHAFV